MHVHMITVITWDTVSAVSHCCCCCCVQELRNDAELQEGNLGWLKARMAVLIEICADSDGQRQGSALSKLSTDFKGLLTSLLEVGEGPLVDSRCQQTQIRRLSPSENLQRSKLLLYD